MLNRWGKRRDEHFEQENHKFQVPSFTSAGDITLSIAQRRVIQSSQLNNLLLNWSNERSGPTILLRS
jgi:hypothetical protein